ETDRWIVVTFDAGTFVLRTSAPIRAAAHDASDLAWDGTLSLTKAEGTIRAEGRAYPSPIGGETVVIDGAFNGAISSPQVGTPILGLAGELRSTSLAAVPIPKSEGMLNGVPWVTVSLVLGGLVAVAVLVKFDTPRAAIRTFGAVVVERVRIESAEKGKEFAKIGDEEMEYEHFESAARAYAKAARLDSENAAHYLLSRGMALAKLHRYAAAARCFERAAGPTHISEALCWAARMNLRLGREDQAAAQVVGA